jgi:hypothetical protein
MKIWIGHKGHTLYWSRSLNTLISYGVEGISPVSLEELVYWRNQNVSKSFV